MTSSPWKGQAPARVIRNNPKTPTASIALMTREIVQALTHDLDPSDWHKVIAHLERGDLLGVENAILGSNHTADHLNNAWSDRFVRALGNTYTGIANRQLHQVGTRMTLQLYQKAARKDPTKSANRFPGVPHNDSFIRGKAAKLVVSVSRDQRQAIREALLSRFNTRLRPETLVRDLKNTIGLDPRRAKALRNFEDKLREAKAKNVDAQVERYRADLIQSRAQSIARTETVSIETEAKQQAWDIARDAGDIPDEAEQEWVSSDDPCEDCQAMDGQRVALGELFVSPKYGPIKGPGLHPNCVCDVILRSVK